MIVQITIIDKGYIVIARKSNRELKGVNNMEIKGEVLRKIRKEKKVTQEELALELKVTPSTISYWERKDYVPDEQYTIAIASALDVSVYKLTGFLPTDSTHIHKKSTNTYQKEIVLLEHLMDSFEKYKKEKEKENKKNTYTDNIEEESSNRGTQNG